jgi:hypothetical protein
VKFFYNPVRHGQPEVSQSHRSAVLFAAASAGLRLRSSRSTRLRRPPIGVLSPNCRTSAASGNAAAVVAAAARPRLRPSDAATRRRAERRRALEPGAGADHRLRRNMKP